MCVWRVRMWVVWMVRVMWMMWMVWMVWVVSMRGVTVTVGTVIAYLPATFIPAPRGATRAAVNAVGVGAAIAMAAT